ncbi:FIG00469690: hypothetical protein [hydrothermal vent metagenome]|uniref:DUF234 domain-containing protein n=1 Tax=hydrothermal vent metagenome TaxID=652676 RepID=A0A1W1EG12_9ZZZZ
MFKEFCEENPYLTIEQSVEYFSILGGAEQSVELDFFDDLFSMIEANFVQNFYKYQSMVSPSYIIESPYRELLMAVARGDGKIYSIFRKARLSQSVGETLVKELISLGVLYIEKSRESPLKVHPKHKVKKELRSYRIQDKLRFVKPFHRFWFGFVTYYSKDLAKGDGENFLDNFHKHYERLRSLIYEQLCNEMLIKYFESDSPLLSSGSYWNQHSEFDILAITSDKRIILGECKYKDRKICKNELNKLKEKALQSGIAVDIYVLFSKNGFSKELENLKDKDLLLFDLHDLNILLD